MENIEREIQKKPKENQEINWADVAVQEAVERTRANLEARQKESRDEFFKRLNIRELTPEALIILNMSMEESGRSLPKDVISGALKIVKDSSIYNNPDAYKNAQERLNCIKDIIVHYPNTFYKKEREE